MHYDEQIAKAVKECREHRKRIEGLSGVEEELLKDMTPLKAHADIVEGYPTSEVSNLINGPQSISNFDEKPLKDTEGKAADARLCFIQDIAEVALDHGVEPELDLITLGEYLYIINESVAVGNISNAEYYCSEALHLAMDDDNALFNLISVRAQALGSGKYEVDSYREKLDINLLLDAAARHFLKMLFEGDIDEESRLPHSAHIAANMVMIHTQLKLSRE